MFMLVYLIINIVLAVLGLETILMLVGLALLVPSLGVGTRRFHDIGRSGWRQLICLVPLTGTIVMFIFLVQDSHDTDDCGVNPKAGLPF